MALPYTASTIQATQARPLEGYSDDILLAVGAALDELSDTSIRLLFHINGLESCARRVCCAKAKTLAERMGCSPRTVRRRFSELQDAEMAHKVRKCSRTAWRGLTELGKAVVLVIKAGGQLAIAAELDARDGGRGGGVSGHLAAHKGRAEHHRGNSSQIPPSSMEADPGETAQAGSSFVRGKFGGGDARSIDPAAYTVPKSSRCIGAGAWGTIAGWLRTAKSVSWARCRMTHRAFDGLAMRIHRTQEWAGFNRAMAARGKFVSSEDLLALAVEDAMSRGKSFGTVQSATTYVAKIAVACVRERRLPGETTPARRRKPSPRPT